MKVSLRRFRSRQLGALVATGILVLLASGGAAEAEGDGELGGFSALAVASGQRTSFTVTKFLVIQDFFDGTGPVAESTLDPTSGGESFASFPYPGATVLQYPAFVALGTGQTPPGYPFYVKAIPTDGDQSLSDPTGSYRLDAKAASDSAESAARLQPAAGEDLRAGTVAKTSIVSDGGKVVATAESLTEGLSIGPLKVAAIASKSVTTLSAGDAEPKTTTEMRIDGGAVNDQRFSFGPDGLIVTQAGIPLPVSQGVEALNAALEPAGLSVRFLRPETIAGGASAGTFEVSANREVGGSSGVFRLRFGQATTAVVPGGDFLSSQPAEEAPPSGGGLPVSGEPAPPPAEAASSPAGLGSVPAPAAAPELPLSDFGSIRARDLPFSAPSPPAFAATGTDYAAPEQAATGEFSAPTAEAALPVPAGGLVPPAGQLASAAVPRAVDGVYAAVAWATIAVLGLSLIWRQGAQKWTS